jgi:hypothetical protein
MGDEDDGRIPFERLFGKNGFEISFNRSSLKKKIFQEFFINETLSYHKEEVDQF